MKIVSRLIAALTLVALTGSVFAQSVSVGSKVGQIGTQVVLEPSFTAGAQQIDVVQFVVEFANPALANFSDVTVSATCGGTMGTSNACVVNPVTKAAFQIIVAGPVAFSDGILASITFSIDAAAPAGDVALVVNPASVIIGFSGVAADPAIPVSDGNIEITLGPQPDYSSVPTPATGVSLSVIQNAADPSMDVNISNIGEATSTLTGTCTKTADPDTAFNISGDTNFSVVQGAAADVVTVSCDSAAGLGLHTGSMSCTHDGSTAASPAVYALSCNITEGPQSAYSDSLAPNPMALAAAQEGDADPTGTLTVTNIGDDTTTLAGACTYTGDSEISIANGAFSLGQNASQLATVSCDASAEGSYSGTISCAHDAGNTRSPVTHAATCVVGPPGPAIYASSPAAGSTIDMTPGDKPPAGTAVADMLLGISNAATDTNDRDLELLTCGYTGDSEITATAPGSTTLAPTVGTSVTFSCDSTTAGAYTGTYSCEYDESGNNEPDGTADYTVNCEVREAASDLSESPVSGTALNFVIPQNGIGQTSVSFTEILDENVDATIDACSFADGTVFSVVTTIPVTVTSGSSVTITVQGQDPFDGSASVTDTLTCTYTDSDSEPGTASWPVTMSIQTAAIPTLSSWGLIAMFLTMLGLGGIVIRRKDLS